MPKSVTRIDHHSTHGYQVRVRWKNKTLPSRLFSDRVCGGKRRALAAALAYRDELEARVKKPRTERTVQSLYGRNTSGTPGIRLGEHDGRPVVFFTYPRAPGVVGTSSVSITRWGLRGAKRRASQLRQERLTAYYKDRQ